MVAHERSKFGFLSIVDVVGEVVCGICVSIGV